MTVGRTFLNLPPQTSQAHSANGAETLDCCPQDAGLSMPATALREPLPSGNLPGKYPLLSFSLKFESMLPGEVWLKLWSLCR